MKVDSGKALWTIIWMVGAAVVAVVVLGEGDVDVCVKFI